MVTTKFHFNFYQLKKLDEIITVRTPEARVITRESNGILGFEIEIDKYSISGCRMPKGLGTYESTYVDCTYKSRIIKNRPLPKWISEALKDDDVVVEISAYEIAPDGFVKLIGKVKHLGLQTEVSKTSKKFWDKRDGIWQEFCKITETTTKYYHGLESSSTYSYNEATGKVLTQEEVNQMAPHTLVADLVEIPYTIREVWRWKFDDQTKVATKLWWVKNRVRYEGNGVEAYPTYSDSGEIIAEEVYTSYMERTVSEYSEEEQFTFVSKRLVETGEYREYVVGMPMLGSDSYDTHATQTWEYTLTNGEKVYQTLG